MTIDEQIKEVLQDIDFYFKAIKSMSFFNYKGINDNYIEMLFENWYINNEILKTLKKQVKENA